MSETHDNTRPAHHGSVSLSQFGVIAYFPIERTGFMKPFMALVLHQRPDGTIVSSIDIRWGDGVMEETE